MRAESAKLHFFPTSEGAAGESRAIKPKVSRLGILFDLILMLPVILFICFYGLGQTSLHHVDETTHVRVTQEMRLDGEWWHPKVFGQSYYNKPPFKMWLTAIPVSILGESNRNYRLVDGFCGLATGLMVYFFALYLFRSRLAGVVAALSLLTARSYVFVHGVRTSTQDAMLLLLLTGAMFAGYVFLQKVLASLSIDDPENRKQTNRQIMLLAIIGGVCIGLSVLTKNVAGFLPLMMIGLFVLFSGRALAIVKRAPLAIAIVVFLSVLIPALYLVPRVLADPHLVSVMFGDEVMHRVTDGYHNRSRIWFYVRRLFRHSVGIPPEMIVGGLVFGFYDLWRGNRYRALFLLIWSIFPVVLFTCIPSRLTWYVAPAFPGMSLLGGAMVAAAVGSLLRVYRGPSFRNVAVGTALVLVLVSCAWGFGNNARFVVDRIMNPPNSRLPFDLIAEQYLAAKKSPESQLRGIAVIDAPKLGRNERLYLDMFTPVEHLADVNELRVRMDAPDAPSLVLADAELFRPLSEAFPFYAYSFLRPANHRNRWAIIFLTHAAPIEELTPVREAYDFDQTPNRFLAGWSSAGRYQGLTVRRTRGTYSAMVIPGDRAKHIYGTTLKVNLSGIPDDLRLLPSVTVYLNDYELGTIEAVTLGFRTYDFVVPPGVYVNGSNVLSFRQTPPEGEGIGLQQETLMFNWVTEYLSQPQPGFGPPSAKSTEE